MNEKKKTNEVGWRCESTGEVGKNTNVWRIDEQRNTVHTRSSQEQQKQIHADCALVFFVLTGGGRGRPTQLDWTYCGGGSFAVVPQQTPQYDE